MKRTIKPILGVLFVPLLFIFFSFGSLQENLHPVFQNILQKFTSYFERLPQQKVYLHLDKYSYNADEILWFKAYLVDASSHRPDSSTTNLYVDLINPSGYIVQSKLIKLTGGTGNGDFSFQDTIPEGVYKIKAFTQWMRNVDEDFFFEREIYVANREYKTYITKEEVFNIKKEKRKNIKREQNYDVQFLPEGGHLLAGIQNKVGFKAINQMGHGSTVEGSIIDSKGNTITEFKSSVYGMGSIDFTPGIKERYTALVNTGGDKILKVQLPEALDAGVSVSANQSRKGFVTVKLIHNFPPLQLPPNTLYFLVGHCRENILFTHEFDLKNTDNSFEVSTADFPSGIIHLTLFNLFSQPVSERLIFVNNQDELKIIAEPSKGVAASRELISVKFKITDKNSLPVISDFSVSVGLLKESWSEENIVSALLLGSDLKGKVENPDYYFSNWNTAKEKELDDLLLTQGWRRFNWTEVLSDTKIRPKYENEQGITITGIITRQFFDIPLRDIIVTLSILNEYNDVFSVRSGERGVFRFENKNYSDTISASLEAVKINGRKNLVIYLDTKSDERDKKMKYQTNQDLRRRGPEGHYVEPVGDDDPYAEQNNRIYRLHQEPQAHNVIIVDETMRTYQSVGDIIQGRVPGVVVNGSKVTIRGINSFYYNTSPLFLVDGMSVDAEYAMSMSPIDVERIEIIKGPEAAIYGSRGANGVIAIYTRRGKFMKKGVLDFKMLGYATPREYYTPGIEYRSDDPFEDDRNTILWMPYVLSDKNGEAAASFITSDVKGSYLIRIEGVSSEGIPGSGSSIIEVR